MEAFLLSFGVIFVAELGDKGQLMALTFAAATGPCRCWSASPSPPRWSTVAFFLADLGDKTMLGTITPATSGAARGVGGLDAGDGRRRRPGDRGRPAAGEAAARAAHPGGATLAPLATVSSWCGCQTGRRGC
jgi:hypothetical protein